MSRSLSRAAFTLVELLVSMAVVSLLLVSLARILADTQFAWMGAKARTDEFREARAAFDAIASKLSQATLNSYWGYKLDPSGVPELYQRQSELHFVCGPVTTLLATSAQASGHGVFFQAPIGESSSTGATASAASSPVDLTQTLNGWGWYARYESDLERRPEFLTASGTPERKRFRLMEFRQPTEKLSLYRMVPPANSSFGTTPLPWIENQRIRTQMYAWFRDTMAADSQPLAENILGVIIQPLWPDPSVASGHDTTLAPNYIYDTRRHQWPDNSTLAARTRHQLPPMVRLTLVALDERDWEPLSNAEADALASELRAVINADLFRVSSDFEKDIRTLETELTSRKLGFRVFTTAVQIPAAKLLTSVEN